MCETEQSFDNPRIFWNVDYTKMDYELRANFIIEGVFERGDVQDIRNCRRYYGNEKVEKVLLNAKFLPLYTTYFVSAIFDKPLEEFRCYILRQLNPELFPY